MDTKTWRLGTKTLFGRLLLYFIIVLVVPLGLFSSFYTLTGESNQVRYLQKQAMDIVSLDAKRLATILEDYRHKAYRISTDNLVVSILKEDVLDVNTRASRELYQLLFGVMKGDTYLASAHLVSNSGKVRISTHEFPEVFDLRYHGNEWDMNNIISQNQNVSQTASLISIRSHRTTELGRQVLASILRRVYDSDGVNLGYLVVEIYAEALTNGINADRVLGEELLIDTVDFSASSLVHSDKFGSFTAFPELANYKGDFSSKVVQEGTSIFAINPVQGTSLVLAGIISSVPFQENLNQWLWAFAVMMGIGTVLAIALSLIFSRSIAKPIRGLASSMKEVEQGNLKTKKEYAKIEEFAQLDHSFNVMVEQISSLIYQTREEQQKVAEAERKALESQMNPHFLFNTLNTIKALARMHGEEEIYTITIKLGKLLRSTIDNHESECTLMESMALIDSYLTIQRIRFGEKLHVTTFLDPACAMVKTPKLIIQPLVENSIVHGLEPKAGDWNIEVYVEEKNGMILLTVKDDGVGFPPGTLPDDLDDLANSTHVGVYNVYRRLVLKYGKKMSFSIVSKEKEGTVVSISFPSDNDKTKGSAV
ncbi:MAG TPA: sensor histidine kinase [Sphaerochaeta sp.]|nr:sensor histidine kinase [Sphaerochaeta sp.]